MLHAPGFAPEGLKRMLLASEPLVVALPEHHVLATVPSLTLSKVLAQPIVIFPRRIVPSLHDAIFAVYHAAGRSPQVVQEAIQMQTIVNLVSAGLGLAWVPQSVRQFQRPGVVYREVGASSRGRGLPGCETSLVWINGKASPSLERFLAFAGTP
jgi:DNA-binding transcriptional LysR family regulator